ncbi:MAG: hypothetical protein AAFY98_09400 [Verrucomicrobiota bacterium]
MVEKNNQIRLKKIAEDEIHGPMDLSELQALAMGAFIAPEDQLSYDGKSWFPAPELTELGMIWVIKGDGEVRYGPTSEGTIREFLLADELAEDHILENVTNGENTTVANLLGENVVNQVLAERAETGLIAMDDIEETLETAKDLRIRQLEVDHEHLQKEHDKLMAQYRKVSEELIRLKKAT